MVRKALHAIDLTMQTAVLLQLQSEEEAKAEAARMVAQVRFEGKQEVRFIVHKCAGYVVLSEQLQQLPAQCVSCLSYTCFTSDPFIKNHVADQRAQGST